MASPILNTAPSLQVRRTFNAPRERVFAAWTQKEQLERWMCRPRPEITVKYREFDLRLGGRHVIEVRLPDGSLYLNSGEYRLIKPPEKLIFTWAWEKFDSSQKRIGEMKGTLVTVEFHEHGDTTEVVLTHEGFPDTAARDSHNNGWNGCFERLAEYLKGQA
jgi:uncharacterized protein YndB with AHSA1/START domain